MEPSRSSYEDPLRANMASARQECKVMHDIKAKSPSCLPIWSSEEPRLILADAKNKDKQSSTSCRFQAEYGLKVAAQKSKENCFHI